MLQSATFSESGITVDNTKFDSKSISVDCSDFLENKLTDDTFGQRLRKSRLELAFSICDVANLCGVTNSVISGYELERYMPTKDILDKLSSKFNIDYLCMEGYAKIIYNFDEFLDKLNIWINENKLTKEDAANKLGVSRSLFRYWLNGGVISIGTYNKINTNFKKYKFLE